MGSIILNFEEKQLSQLQAKAKELKFSSVEELLIKMADRLIETHEINFESAMQYVLKKYKELYTRLA